MASNTDKQTVPLDQIADIPLDQWPEAMQRVPLADIGLDGITDAMLPDLDATPFSDQTRTAGIWTKVS